MLFPVSCVITDTLNAVLANKINANAANGGKTFHITNIRINNTDNGTAYKVWLYLKFPEKKDDFLLSYDELDAGDYLNDDTKFAIPPGHSLLAKTDISGTTVQIVINGEEK